MFLHQKAAALRLASFKKLGLLTKLTEAADTTPASVRNAANKMKGVDMTTMPTAGREF